MEIISENGEFKDIDAQALLDKIGQAEIFRKVKRKEIPYTTNSFLKVFVGIGKIYTPNFVMDKDNSFTYSNIVAWALGHPFKCYSPDGKSVIDGDTAKGLYIYGNTGTGKSLALRILDVLCQKCGITVQFSNHSVILGWDNTRSTDITNAYAQNGDSKKYIDNYIQCIQDLGSEPHETLYMGNRVNVLRQVLEARGDRQDRLTLITSNYQLSEIDSDGMYGNRVASRLVAMCNFFFLGGKDRRI